MKCLLFSLALWFAVTPLRAEDVSSSGELSLPWAAFEKLLHPDRENVSLSWDEFQRLLRQTGIEEAPPFQVQNGQVLLSRPEFKRLLDLMRPPSGGEAKYFLTKAVYSAQVGFKRALVTARMRLQIPNSGKEIPPMRIPLFPGTMAFQEILLDGKPALIENENGRTYLTAVASGDHEITASFSSPGSLEKAPYEIHFPTPRTPITRLIVNLPLKDVDVSVQNASQTEVVRIGQSTEVRADLPPSEKISVTWNPVEPEKEKGPAKIYSVVHNLLSVEEDVLRVTTRLELDVMQNTINALNVRVPEGYSVLDVQGDSLGEWKVRGNSPNQVLVIPLAYARKDHFGLTLMAEQALKEKSGVAHYSGFQVLTAVRESGDLGVELKTTAEAKVLESQGLNRLDVQELSPALLNLCQRPLLYGFRYARAPFSLGLDIQRHAEVAVLSTVADEANGVTLLMEDGKRVHHITYTVRNSWKQFLELSLPKGSQVWSAFVEGSPVKPSRNAADNVLIPLNRSRTTNGDISGFDVEVMYYEDGRSPLAGLETLTFPSADIVVSQLLWSVYLPVTCDVLYFGGDLDKEKKAEGVRPLLSTLRGRRRVLQDLSTSSLLDYDQSGVEKDQKLAQAKESAQWRSRGKFSESQGIKEESYARQVERELNFLGQVQKAGNISGNTGVLPIRVQVPNTGQVFRFSKRIITEQRPLVLKAAYVRNWLMTLAKILLLTLILWLLYCFRTWTAQIWVNLKYWVQKHEAEISWACSPAGLMILCLGIAIVFVFLSRLLAVLVFLAFLGAATRWFLNRKSGKSDNLKSQ